MRREDDQDTLGLIRDLMCFNATVILNVTVILIGVDIPCSGLPARRTARPPHRPVDPARRPARPQ